VRRLPVDDLSETPPGPTIRAVLDNQHHGEVLPAERLEQSHGFINDSAFIRGFEENMVIQKWACPPAIVDIP
jgi:hypothetical protein